jgi:hypothetical protein
MNNIQIKNFLRGFSVNTLGICIKEKGQFYTLTKNENITTWGIENKLISLNNNSFTFNSKKIRQMMKNFDLTIKIFKTNVREYSTPIDNSLDNNNQFGYKMIIISNKKIVFSLELNACDYASGTDADIKKNIFQTFNSFSEKYLFLIMFFLSNML